jgi:phospholipase C
MSNSLNLIENIVVVMLENRSFDQMLGTLYSNSSQFEGLKLDGSMYNTWNGVKYPVTNTSSGNPFTTPTPDPGESFPDMNLQIFNTTDPAAGATANMAGFVNDYAAGLKGSLPYPGIPIDKECPWAPSWPALPRVDPTTKKVAVPGDIMFYFTPSQLPVTSLLAQSFGVSDAWFGSCPTQTYPNRFFLNCATSGGYVEDVDYLCNLELWPDLPSIFQLLDGNGKYNSANWKVYFHDFSIATLIKYVLLSAPVRPLMVCNFDTSDFGGDTKSPTFAEDVQNQTLPKYSFIEPRYGGINNLAPNDNHPPFDVCDGETLVGTIYNLLRGSAYYWPRTLLIITYDEHGGCFDHVIPPTAVAPGGTVLPRPSGFGFNRYGPRVPAILVSPYIPAGSIVRPAGFSYVQGAGTSTTNGATPFDHTSVIRTIVECFNISSGAANLTQRDANAPSLADALSLGSTNMNNGPSSVVLPNAGAAATAVGDSHLAEVYNAMLTRFGSSTSGE